VIIATVVGLGSLVYYAESVASGGFPLPCATSVSMHVHPYLQIIINGQNVTIPADVGISSSCLEPIHTHDASGILHLETPGTSTNYTLGQFFQIWSATDHTVAVDGQARPIVFNSTDILGFKADATHKVVLLVDGKPSSEYASLVLNTLDYCSAATTGPPCSPTAVGDPAYGGQPYPYGTGHTIVIEYEASG
jgi:hypothetical protein